LNNFNFKDIHDSILKYIEEIENELMLSSDADEDNSAKKKAYELITKFKNEEFQKAIEALKKSEEWDTFSIAFYGETNAGKSTILESLRIHFQEKTKQDMREEFEQCHLEYEKQKNAIEDKINISKLKIEKYETTKYEIFDGFKNKKIRIEEEIENLEKKHLENLENVLYKIVVWLNISLIKKNIKKLKINLQKNEKIYEIQKIDIEKDIEDEKSIETLLQSKLLSIDDKYRIKFEQLGDGQIIGDGRSDYTQETTSYLIEHKNQKFSFLDVPGIEGKESNVIDEINMAVKKAHAVFYVTSSPTLPQKGDNGKKGTLEKIKEHLSSQTEVYTIYNKRITNPMQLTQEIVNGDELSSLTALDDKVEEILSNSYRGHKYLSAKVAFLALSNHISPFSKTKNEKEKFLKKFDKGELLIKSNFYDFIDFITNDLVVNTKQKIKKSNFTKTNDVLKEFISVLQKVSTEIFIPLYKELSKEKEDVFKNLDRSLKAFERNSKKKVDNSIQRFSRKTRKEVYEFIDKNKSDKEFEEYLKKVMKVNGEKYLHEELLKGLNEEIEKIKESIEKNIENYRRRVRLLVEDFDGINLGNDNINFTFDINLDNGVDGWGIFGSTLGSGGLLWATLGTAMTPIGWAIFAVGALTVLISLGKSVWKYFSDDYKKAQQKKSTTENIDKNSKLFKKNVLEELKKPFYDYSEMIENIKKDLDNGVQQVEYTNMYVGEARKSLDTLSIEIKKEGEKYEQNSE